MTSYMERLNFSSADWHKLESCARSVKHVLGVQAALTMKRPWRKLGSRMIRMMTATCWEVGMYIHLPTHLGVLIKPHGLRIPRVPLPHQAARRNIRSKWRPPCLSTCQCSSFPSCHPRHHRTRCLERHGWDVGVSSASLKIQSWPPGSAQFAGCLVLNAFAQVIGDVPSVDSTTTQTSRLAPTTGAGLRGVL